MADCIADDPQIEPLWALNIKDYDRQELETLVSYINQTMTWFESQGIHTSTTDVVGFRAGMPVVTPTAELETTALYTVNDDLDQLVTALSLDVLKVSVKKVDGNLVQSQPYTFKSAFTHDMFTKYFYYGVENNSGLAYLDDRRMTLSAETGIPIMYDGAEAKALPALAIPTALYGCVVYLIQNATLYTKYSGTGDVNVPKKGDVTYYSTKGFYDHINTIKTNALDVLARLATPQQEAMHELLVYLGVDDAFRNIQFGGAFNDMRVLMRIPTSRENQLTLEGLLGEGDVFGNIFKVKTFIHTDRDVSDNEKKEHLLDEYSTSKLTYPELGDSPDGYYGCRSGSTYRYWYVSEAWLSTLTTEQLSIVFWMGLDIVTEQGNPCPYDELLAIIIVVVMTFFSAGLGTATSLTIMQGLTVLSGILSIATITGNISVKDAAIIGAVLAVASFGTSMLSSGLTITSGFSQAISLASTVLDTVQKLDMIDFQEEVDSKKEQLESIQEDADMWESEFRFTYGGSFEMGVRGGPEADPYKYVKDTYDAYAIYKTSGFQ